MSATGRAAPRSQRRADREIGFTGHQCPTGVVFEAFTEVRHLSQWWDGGVHTTLRGPFEFRAGGGVGLRDARTGRAGLPGVDLLDRDRFAGAIALLHRESRGDPNAFESS